MRVRGGRLLLYLKLVILNQHFEWDTQPFVQFPHHLKRQLPLVVEHHFNRVGFYARIFLRLVASISSSAA